MRWFICALMLVGCAIDEGEVEPAGSESDLESTSEDTGVEVLAPIDELEDPGAGASAPVPQYHALYEVPVSEEYVVCTVPKGGGPQSCVHLWHDVIHEIACYSSCEFPYHLTCYDTATIDFCEAPDSHYLVASSWTSCG